MYEEIDKYLLSWLENGYTPPYKIHILPTGKCNLKCRSCWRWKYESGRPLHWFKEEMSDEKLLTLVNEGAQLGVKLWEISGGGEPFIRREVVLKMMENIKSLNMDGDVTTNGTLFTPEIIEFLINIKWNRIKISLDGPNHEINDYLRPPEGTFDKIISCLELFNEYKKKLNSHKPILDLICVLSKANVGYLISMVKLAIKFNINHLVFEPIKMYSPPAKDLQLEDKDYFKIKDQLPIAKKLAGSEGLNTNLDFLYLCRKKEDEVKGNNSNFVNSNGGGNKKNSMLKLVCYEPWYRIVINAKGECSPCCIAPYSSEENIKYKSLLDIWLGEYFEEIRERILTHNLLSSCEECSTSLISHSHFIKEKLLQNTTSNRGDNKNLVLRQDSLKRIKTSHKKLIRHLYEKFEQQQEKFICLLNQHQEKLDELEKNFLNKCSEVERLEEKLKLRQKDLEVAKKGFMEKNEELENIYNSTGFKYLLKPLWSIIGPPKRFIKKIFMKLYHIISKKII